MNDAVVRAIRTFLQGFVGVLALLAVPILSTMIQSATGGGEIEVDLNVWRTVLIAGMAGGFIALISLAQNWLEDKTGKSLLK